MNAFYVIAIVAVIEGIGLIFAVAMCKAAARGDRCGCGNGCGNVD